MFIGDIFKKRQWGKLIEWLHAPYVEVVREFYTNYNSFNLYNHSITFIVTGQTLKFSFIVIIKLYELFEITEILPFSIKK
jgi:hypothetical protein